MEDALRIALCAIKEHVELVTRMVEDARNAARPSVATLYDDRALVYRQYTETLRRAMLISLPPAEPAEDEEPVA